MSGRAYLSFLGLASAAVAAFAIHALSSVEPTTTVVDLPAHVTRLAFGVDEWPSAEEPGCFEGLELEPVPEPHAERRRVYLEDLTFLGEGDWMLGATVVRRRASDLAVCYDEDVEGERVEIALQSWGPPRVSGAGEREACLSEAVAAWPWPQDLVGRVSISLRTGWLI